MSDILKAKNATEEAKGKLNGQLTRLHGDLEQIGSNWQGTGRVGFNNVMAAWNNQSARLVAALDNFIDNLNKTDSDWHVTEDEVNQAFTRLNARLG